MKRALITDVSGQDGAYLAELLLGKGYEVHALVRRAGRDGADGGDAGAHSDVAASLNLHPGTLADGGFLGALLADAALDEVYDLGPPGGGDVAEEGTEPAAETSGAGTFQLLDAVRHQQRRGGRTVRYCHAGSADMFGASPPPQSERTPFRPLDAVAAAHVAAQRQVVAYRETHGLHAGNAILFDHASERAGEASLPRQVTRAATRIRLGLRSELRLDNLDAKRDWGHTRDHVEALWRMLQQDEPDDYVIATGVTTTVRGFVSKVFTRLGLDWQDYVASDERPAPVAALQGDPSRALERLGWRPRIGLDELIERMINRDLQLARQEKALRDAGDDVTGRADG